MIKAIAYKFLVVLASVGLLQANDLGPIHRNPFQKKTDETPSLEDAFGDLFTLTRTQIGKRDFFKYIIEIERGSMQGLPNDVFLVTCDSKGEKVFAGELKLHLDNVKNGNPEVIRFLFFLKKDFERSATINFIWQTNLRPTVRSYSLRSEGASGK